MEIVNLKKWVLNGSILLALLVFNINTSEAQQWTYINGGTYNFNSVQPTENLSFFLYGDGYHSFEQQEEHDYKYSGFEPLHYSAVPYDDDDDVEEFVMPTIGNSTTTPAIVKMPMDNMVSIERSWNLVEDKMNYYVLKFENREASGENISGCIEFHYNINETSINEADVLDYQFNNWVHSDSHTESNYSDFTHKFTWFFDDLALEEQRFIYFPADCLGEVFDRIKTRAVMKIDEDPEDGEDPCAEFLPYISRDDGSSSKNDFAAIYTLISKVSSNPHDPNMIEPTPHGLFKCQSNQIVNYKVTFQNEGETAAEDVTIRINCNADFENVKLLNASDQCYLVQGTNSIDVIFEDIYLPGMGQMPRPNDYWETVGSVEFEVCFNYDSVIDDYIKMDGAIEFDEEEPISISSTIPKYQECTPLFESNYPYAHENPMEYMRYHCDSSPPIQWFDGAGSEGSLFKSNEGGANLVDIIITPNPVDYLLEISGINNSERPILNIFNSQGLLINRIEVDEYFNNKIDVSSYIPGLYIIGIEQGNRTTSKKFIKH